MTAIDVVALGEPMVEFNQTHPGEPNYLQGFGGDSSNMIIAAARSGARTAYVSRLGDDAFGRMFMSLWKAEGINTQGVDIDPDGYTAAYVVTHGEQGHVFSYLRAGSAASRMRPGDLPVELLRQARYVHASGISMGISRSAQETVMTAFETARAAGAKISFDSNLRLKLWPLSRAQAAMAAAVPLADFFFPSIEDARALSGAAEPDALLDWAHGLGAKHVFLKMGADGVIVSDGTARTHIPGLKVNAIDATGAGDCFCGAALARLALGDSIYDAARYANVAAALSTTGFGAVDPLPRTVAVRNAMSGAHPSP